MKRSLEKRLQSFDAFPKISEEYTQKSKLGGLLTFFVTAVSLILMYGELLSYLELKQEFEFLVEPASGNNEMQMNVDMTVAMPCKYLNVDVQDVVGNSIHMQDKIRLSNAHFENRQAKAFGSEKSPDFEDEDLSDLIYRGNKEKGQINEVAIEGSATDACRILGSFKVQKVAGNFHITAQGHGHGGTHTPHDAFNFTHRIDKFSFGLHYPKLVNPLDNSIGAIETILDKFQYFMSVVPTIYIDNSDNILVTNQYSVTNHRTSPSEESASIPGIFFQYDIEALLIRITEKRQKLSTFLVRLCGIIGGIWASMGFFHTLLAKGISLAAQKTSSQNVRRY